MSLGELVDASAGADDKPACWAAVAQGGNMILGLMKPFGRAPVQLPHDFDRPGCRVESGAIFDFFVFLARALSMPVPSSGSKACGIGRRLLCRNISIIEGKRPEPAAAFPWPFEGDELHLFSGVSDLSFAESALLAPLYD
jgi:hypothetical protein